MYGGKIVAHLFQRNEIHGSPLNVSGFSLFVLLYKLYILIKKPYIACVAGKL